MAMDKEKQKFLLVGVLGAVLLAIGVFQFATLGGESPRPARKTAESSEASEPAPALEVAPVAAPETPSESDQPPAFQGLYAARDPFAVVPLAPSLTPTPREETASAPPPTRTAPRRSEPSGPRGPESFDRSSIPPLDPLPGAAPNPGEGVALTPGTPLRNPDELPYTLCGVLLGDRPVAILRSDEGHQKMVPLGGKIDGRAQIVEISRGKVTIEHDGKREVLRMGGTPGAKESG